MNSIDFVKNTLTFWDKITPIDRRLIMDNIALLHYKKGTHIYHTELDCMGILIVKSGELRVYLLSEDGRDITLYRLTPGEVCVLSASCVLKNITFDVHIDAEQDSELLLLNANFFQELYNKNIYVENFASKLTIRRFSEVMWAMQQILFMSFDKRLALFLLNESKKNNSDIIYLSHEQIAKYVSSAREVVSRMLKYFSNEGIVKLSRGQVILLDKAKLEKIL
ncbi:Crp/Fnr family transcriptional regulator [Anaerosinus gibii]|uniref:Crp/Fnr family transcriptional regulator n=1 Tax=Selenobaculum gibii TaxID=3054208 RepID=A0A9Y2AHK2_9FIRM|nr:Crp/Fnr family transcriptional regulator [Selenobaculum gbiensis]WIW70214.1 Crp/Fnr family transcriptional regulator [Selenobaculum gbiensis]